MNLALISAILMAGGRPVGVPYEEYANLVKSEGQDPLDEDDYNGRDEMTLVKGSPDDTDDNDTGDNDVDSDKLTKALSDYQNVVSAMAEAGNSRQAYLESRMTAGTISKSERVELGKIWAGDDTDLNKSRVKTVGESIRDDDQTSQLIDASDFLKSLVDSVDGSLEAVSSEVTRDGRATRELLKAQGAMMVVMGEHMAQQDEILKSQSAIIEALADRLDLVSRQPSQRRSVGRHDPRDIQPRALAKSSVDGGGNDNKLTKADVFRGLHRLLEKASDRNDDQAIDALTKATARFESSQVIPANILRAVEEEISQSA